MLHWLSNAFSVYGLHPTVGPGYQWWSGPGGDVFILTGLVALGKHINCEQKGCWRPGHRHPEHGRPVCRHHYHHDVVPEKA